MFEALGQNLLFQRMQVNIVKQNLQKNQSSYRKMQSYFKSKYFLNFNAK